MEWLSDVWRQEYWLPPGVTWADMDQLAHSDRPLPLDLVIALPLSLVFVTLRCLFERYSSPGFLLDSTSSEGGRIFSGPLVKRLHWAQSNLMGFFVNTHTLLCLHAGAPSPHVTATNHQRLLAFAWSLFSPWPAGSWPRPWADVWGLGIKCKPLQPPPQSWSRFTPRGADSLHRLVWIEAVQSCSAPQLCLKERSRAHYTF